ncbi:MAG: exodeoxyribonuclease VII large subunit [Cellvibrionaceae bacterium]
MSNTPLIKNPPNREVISVSQLNRKAKQLLETHISLTWVEGEISNFAAPASGHWYFTLKDADAQVRCAMFRGRNSLARFKPKQGQQVLIRARVSLYEGRGEYQLIAEHIEEAGFGVLQRAFEALKTKLSKEGLFEEEHKQAIPSIPKHLAVITSPTGAAIRDVLSVLERRFAGIPVTVIPVQVQGEGAAQQISDAIQLANKANRFDVILLTRGGGSLEDLWPFNEEIVARTIFDSQLPILSAVGHEIDFTISDFVADFRAPTPSAAAEILSPDGVDLMQTFSGFDILLGQSLQRVVNHNKHCVHSLSSRLRHPGERIQSRAQHLDNLEMRMQKAIGFTLHESKSTLQSVTQRQQHLHPGKKIDQLIHHVNQLTVRSTLQIQQKIKSEKNNLGKVAEILQTVSPLNTLRRGYSVSLDAKGTILKNTNKVSVGDTITTKLGDGELQCTVDDINPEYSSASAPFKKYHPLF